MVTSIIINCVTQIWNILNIKSPAVGHHLNDVNRLPFTDQRDERLVFLCDMATSFKLMVVCEVIELMG